jgi:hypothetical protein
MVRDSTSWIPVSTLSINFNENKFPNTDDLSGKEFLLYSSDNQIRKYVFQDVQNLTREDVTPENSREPIKEKYEAIKIDSGIYFLDFVKEKSPKTSVSMALNLNTCQALVIDTTVPGKREASRSLLTRMKAGLDLSSMKVTLSLVNINKTYNASTPKSIIKTQDLIGKRIRYFYSHLHIYEHIYLTSRYYCWQCLSGPEKGTADTDLCDYFKIAQGIYVLIWREKVVPTAGIVLINLNNMRSNGKIFGLDIPSYKPVNFTMGAYAEIISDSTYK